MTTHLALIVNTELDNGTALQTIIVPDHSTTSCVFRESNGSRGRGSAWQDSTINTVIKQQGHKGSVTTISGYAISDKDLAQLSVGFATNAGIKGLAVVDSGTSMDTTHGSAVADINSAILSGDSQYLLTYLDRKSVV